jgi:Ca-activated chloride channel family protein
LPDLFAGTQLILAGRYRGDGPTRIVLTGEVEGEERTFVYEDTFGNAGGSAFIPRLWAARKIGYLLTQIRLHSEREEWVDAVIELSTRYGIVTPYTSFLIQEDLWTEGGREEATERFLAMPTPPAAGAPAVEMADAEAGLRAAEAVGGETMPPEVADLVRHAGTKTFILRDGVWIDTSFDPEAMTPIEIGFGSEAYFDLLAAQPESGQYMAIGSQVLWVADGTAYQIVADDAEPVVIPTSEPDVPTPAGATGPTSARPDGSDGLCSGLGLVGLLVGFVLVGWLRRT